MPEGNIFSVLRPLISLNANFGRWYFAGAFALVSLVGYGQTLGCRNSKPSRANEKQLANCPGQPITGRGRVTWFGRSTIGLQSLTGGLFSAGFGTAVNSPKEYGTHWDGYGKRYGMRLSGVSTGNLMEAGIGSFWGEDPRYFRAPTKPFGGRLQNVVKMTFLAHHQGNNCMPAYARYIGIAGNNVLSNTWRADSEADARHAAERTLLGFAGRMGSNAFQEFWPDVRTRLSRKKP